MKTPSQIAQSMPFWNDANFWDKQIRRHKQYLSAVKSNAYLYFENRPDVEDHDGWVLLGRIEYLKENHREAHIATTLKKRIYLSLADEIAQSRYLSPDFFMS